MIVVILAVHNMYNASIESLMTLGVSKYDYNREILRLWPDRSIFLFIVMTASTFKKLKIGLQPYCIRQSLSSSSVTFPDSKF
jgi:hypothetical protein